MNHSRTLTGVILAAGVVVMVGCRNETREAQPNKDQQKGATSMPAEKTTADIGKYGFRYDPMEYVRNAPGVDGALLRTFTFGTPLPTDRAVLDSAREEIRREQLPDGSWEGSADKTARQLRRLLELGEDPNSPAAQKAGRAILEHHSRRADGDADKALHLYAVEALSRLGMTDAAEVQKAVRRFVKETSKWDQGCPYLHSIHWGCLWPARSIEGVREAITINMGQFAKSIDETGMTHLVPWDILRVCGQIDTPEAAALARKTIPVILRCQKPDGGWDGIDEGQRASFYTLRALKRHGLLEALCEADPLPSEWRITRSIPAPTGYAKWYWNCLTWDGRRLWTVDAEAGVAIAVSPEDGKVLKRVKLPVSEVSIWWWRDSLLIGHGGRKTLYLVDPDTGEARQKWTPKAPHWINAVIPFGDRLFLTDYYYGCLWELDPDSGEAHRPDERSLGVYATTVQDDTVWGYAVQPQYITRFNLKGQRLEWAGNPFVGEVRGLAWDGKNLWALDAGNKRICVIERIESGKGLTGTSRSRQ